VIYLYVYAVGVLIVAALIALTMGLNGDPLYEHPDLNKKDMVMLALLWPVVMAAGTVTGLVHGYMWSWHWAGRRLAAWLDQRDRLEQAVADGYNPEDPT
jgi:hypothetical protein